jgi:two-component system CheB/CheR fusion protein
MFATDIDHEAIEKARLGVYPASIAADVSPERLARFFTHEEEDFYRVKKVVRDQVVFAEQDMLRDPPFSKLDLVSCRNLLIYLESALQKKLLPLFHYALNSGGYLFLGNSESIGEFSSLFTVLDRKWKIYRRRELSVAAVGTFMVPHLPLGQTREPRALANEADQARTSVRAQTERLLLQSYAPACVAVNEHGEILYVHGRTGKFLEIPPGEASLNVVRAAREGLKLELANALRKVLTLRKPVRYERLELRTSREVEHVSITAQLAEEFAPESNVVIITFEDSPAAAASGPAVLPVESPSNGGTSDARDARIAALERELRMKGETLQTTVEELETSNEELKSANEELQSTNEELQSTNEELETSKEELQSVNEELVTVNTELQKKIEGLSRVNNDMNNLLAGTGIGMLFVDHQLHIQRFTPATTQIINLIHTDVGRPVSDLVSNLVAYDNLEADVKSVLDTLVPREAEVKTRSGHWYLMRILPYRTSDNVIEGAVITFVDIAAQKRAESRTRQANVELEQRVAELTNPPPDQHDRPA